jgi:demethylmenaquinone methyltransferase/2-methoxy-6-polyprenyl-1,4-benzoquinol methylase
MGAAAGPIESATMRTDGGDLVATGHPQPSGGGPSEGARDLVTYYRLRAAEYDEVYNKPDRQVDIALMGPRLVHFLSGRHVLGVAAGTGYWTAIYAQAAERLTVTDINSSVLDIARDRRTWPGTVYLPTRRCLRPRHRSRGLRCRLRRVLVVPHHSPNAGYLPPAPAIGARRRCGPRQPLRRSQQPPHHTTRREGNTYQHRQLADGSSREVLKTFPAPTEWAARLSLFGREVAVEELAYYWLATLRTPLPPSKYLAAAQGIIESPTRRNPDWGIT